MKALTHKQVNDIRRVERELERNHMPRSAGETYFVNEDLKQDWSIKEVRAFEKMWGKGDHIYEIAEKFDCDPDEIFLLLFDRVRRAKGFMKPKVNIQQLLFEYWECKE
ncbi:hypothetical protein [Bacillus sp. FJAT-45350]|uniref:hypothetical protein n=1 Tax=Bacillus sp. FJAT-45350 TaxID=2011014 RepID=UPI000BB74DAA|nr:hypothetical protein [Bacillus sp. FJAT-45350]